MTFHYWNHGPCGGWVTVVVSLIDGKWRGPRGFIWATGSWPTWKPSKSGCECTTASQSVEAPIRIINLVLTCHRRYLLLPYLGVSQIVIPMPCTISPASISYWMIGNIPSKLEEHGAKVVKQAKREYCKTKQPIVLRQRHVDRLDTPLLAWTGWDPMFGRN